jgi:hypothetical protein
MSETLLGKMRTIIGEQLGIDAQGRDGMKRFSPERREENRGIQFFPQPGKFGDGWFSLWLCVSVVNGLS